MKYKQYVKGMSNSFLVGLSMERFKLGSLDSMLLNLEKSKKLET